MAAASMGACWGGDVVDLEDEAPAPAVVISNPIHGAASGSPAARSAGFATAADEVVYVSLAADSFPAGRFVTLRNPRAGTTVSDSMVNGGLDAVPVAASQGDTVTVEVFGSAGLVAQFEVPVPEARKPRVTTGGAAYCWGWNGNGEFGNGAIERADYIWNPTAAAGGLTFSALDAGAYHTCGLSPAGKAYCWGGNFFGQVGSPPQPPWNQPSPVEVAGGHTFSAISVGWSHACGRTSGGTVYCWGLNHRGQLGNGGRTDEPGCGQAADTNASPYCSLPVKVAGQR
ncbi:MAG: hypothetical protein HY337_08235 [Gemmatimonadetes bacterium]|nr:hypothetical protein [Gemmatimonadota bacterium]